MATHVLVPVDGSDPADDALEFALSEHPDAAITALHVIDPSGLPGAPAVETELPDRFDEFRERQAAAAERILEEAAALAADHDRSIETERMIGAAAHSIVEFADGRGADRIVIGNHGRTGASRALFGSITETVARRAPTPVTIVR